MLTSWGIILDHLGGQIPLQWSLGEGRRRARVREADAKMETEAEGLKTQAAGEYKGRQARQYKKSLESKNSALTRTCF